MAGGFDLPQQKDTKHSQQREKTHRTKSAGNQLVFQELSPSGIKKDMLKSPATDCDNMCEVCLSGMLFKASAQVLIAFSHMGTVCLACTKIQDSQKECSLWQNIY